MLVDLPLPASVVTRTGACALRRASADDIRAILDLLADDAVGAGRGDADDEGSRAGLAAVLGDSGNDLVVAEDGDALVGMLQLTRIPGVARGGTTRLLVEAVRVASSRRSAGLGTAMMRWVIDAAAPATGATLVQLTSDARRADAHRFYERLGFSPSHVGFKLRLERVTAPGR